jgi:putative ABC transport system permease protein
MRLYRALLHLYPASFRGEYGEEMCGIFAVKRGNFAVSLRWFLWLETVFEIAVNAAAVHFDILKQDLVYAARSFRQALGFTITAIVVAALGIGATTAAFTMVDHVLIRPLAYADSDRLVKLYEDHSFAVGALMGPGWDVAPAQYRDWRNMNHSFERMGAFSSLGTTMIDRGEPQRLNGTRVTADVFPALGVTPLMGRYFSEEEDREKAPGTVVLSYKLWQGTFAGDQFVLGRKLVFDDGVYTVIGVMPKNFFFPSRDSEFWTAMRFSAENFQDRNDNYTYGVARLKPGVSLKQAATDMNTVAAQLSRQYPKELSHVGANVIKFQDDIGSQSKMMLYVLLGAALCVLLVACTNLANLLLARAMTRRKELAVRSAMGAGRERLVRQMLTESVVLSLTGGAIGVFLAVNALPLLTKLIPVFLPIAEVPAIDLRVLVVALTITLATGIGFGALPALRVSRSKDASGLRDSSRSGGGRRELLRSVLVTAQVALSVVLLVSCGLMIRALLRVQAVDPGFRAENVLTMRTVLPMPKYEKNAAREAFYEQVLSQAQRLPGVTGAAYTSFLPIAMGGGIWQFAVDGETKDLSSRKTASLRFVTPGYLGTMGIPLRMGRDVSESDTFTSQFVAVVSESFVKRYWPGQNPIGRHFIFGNANSPETRKSYDKMIVGVVGDVKVRGLEREAEPQVYLPYKQHSQVGLFYSPKDLVVRGNSNVASLTASLRRIIHEADPTQPVTSVRMLSEVVEANTASRKLQVNVLATFAGIAFLLAAIGIHGLLAFAVSSRTQEIGVRMALGASTENVLSMILREGAVLAVIGIVVGAGLAYGAGRSLEALLAGVAPTDALSFTAAIGLCLVMTLIGSLPPAVRAVRIDPVTAIRSE